MNLHQRAHQLLASRGYQVRKHPGLHRQQRLNSHNVDLVLDVGAAVGAYAKELRRFGYEGRIVSFEPLTAAFAVLRTASESDPLWVAVKSALGDEDSETEINVAGNSDSSSLLPMLETHRGVAPHANYVGVETIRVQRLDDAARAEVRTASSPFLKIDTQGFERDVLLGAKETLPQVVGIEIELSFVPLYEGSMLADEAISHLYSLGFSLDGVEPGLRHPETGKLLQADGLFFRQGDV
jgi:FkbM family methyltransferase